MARPIPPTAKTFTSGDKVLEHYVLDRPLGHGGMGAVWLAHHELSHQKVAVKILRADIDDAETRERFIREAKTLAELDHPFIVPLLTFAANADGHFLVMKYIDGSTLEEAINNDGLDFEDIRKISIQVLEALSFAHDRHIIHRDIKPGNVLLSSTGSVFLADFGIARQKQDARVTQAGMLMGTPLYLSPEQVGGADVDAASDLYGFGAILHEMLTGKPPFDFATIGEILNAKLTRPVIVPAASRQRELPEDLRVLANDLLQREPEKRPTIEEALERLHPKTTLSPEVAASTNKVITESSRLNPMAEKSTRKTWPLLAGLVFSGVLVAGLFFGGKQLLGSDKTSEDPTKVTANDDVIQSIQADIKNGRFTDAAISAQRLLSVSPERNDARAYRLLALAGGGRYDEAEKESDALVSLKDLSPSLTAEVANARKVLASKRAEKEAAAAKAKQEAEAQVKKPTSGDKETTKPKVTPPKRVKPVDFKASMLNAAVSSTKSKASACLSQTPGASVTFNLKISKSGKVSRARPSKTVKSTPQLLKCLQRVVFSWRFPTLKSDASAKHTFR